MDNECIDFRAKVTDDHDYKPYLDAVKDGYLKESAIDTALVRLFTARIKLGHVRSAADGSLHEDRRRANWTAPSIAHWRSSWPMSRMVLLKNDGALPLKTTGTKILVVGPLAEQTRMLLGNYNGIPTHTVSILEGLKQEFAGDTINFMQGTGF